MLPLDEPVRHLELPYTVFPSVTSHRTQPGKAHILIVDDEEGIRDVFKEMLEDRGYACSTAPSGEEALGVLSNTTVDLLLLDILMPQMSGLTCFQNIRERFPEVAVIFVTAMDDLAVAVRNIRGGAYDYLVKPVTARRLVQAVEEVLAKRNAQLAERVQQELLEQERSMQMDQQVRELMALNRLFQQHLERHFTLVEAYRDLLDRYLKTEGNRETQHELIQSQLPPELLEPPKA